LGELSQHIAAFFTTERIVGLVKALVILLAGMLAARFGGRALRQIVGKRGDAQQAQLLGRLATWALFGLAVGWSLQELGFQLGVLLGAAGVLTVAVGFASQTTLSNLISGFFLFGERPFRLGDLIEVEGVTGEVLSVDLMATKLRTAENHFVRIPNELMIKTKVKNLTRFPLRRLDLKIPVAYSEDLQRVRQLLLEVASQSVLCLDEPAPLFFVSEFADSKVVVQFSVWGQTGAYAELRSGLTLDIKQAFQEHGIRPPQPEAPPVT